ncbi:aspartate carbamoyltransferase regulatory subunit [Candidatus Woesearchaeota archaeon]|nr:aspartate carbamoyltransferase regulatory subunit [Candidatus Woesearchaeota archaeon]
MKKPLVGEIGFGTVIDHIPCTATFKVLQLLGPQDDLVVVGNHFSSMKIGKKGIIKIANKILTEKELSKIAVLAPKATVNVINNGKVQQKYKITIPPQFKNVIKCINPNCISNHENSGTLFCVISANPLRVKCNYCEIVIDKEEIQLQ